MRRRSRLPVRSTKHFSRTSSASSMPTPRGHNSRRARRLPDRSPRLHTAAPQRQPRVAKPVQRRALCAPVSPALRASGGSAEPAGAVPMLFARFFRIARNLLWAGSAVVLFTVVSQMVRAQTALPEVVVRAPSPIVHRPPARRPSVPSTGPAAPAEPAPAPAAPAEAALPGTLPIVTDQFATVTVLPNDEIRRSVGGTLRDLLFAKPGITGSSFAPGASSRPIIRGLDVNRVGILENGVGGGGVSDLGEDHFVPLDPLTTDQIEALR